MAATTFYVMTTGANTNSGSSEATSPIANGTAATRSTNVYTLDGSPDLSGVTANQDTIHIVGETSGRGSDGTIFEITAVNDGADTVTVSPTPTGGTSGLTWAIGGAFATISKALDVVEAADKVWVKATGTYSEQATTHTSGGPTTIIVFEGYTTTTGDNGRVTIDSPSTYCVNASSNGAYYSWRNFTFTGGSGDGFYTSLIDYQNFYNCKFSNNTNHGARVDNYNHFVNCEFTGNGAEGCEANGNTMFLGCIFHTNTGGATDAGNAQPWFYRCLFYNNSTTLAAISGTTRLVVGCTFDGDGCTGSAISNASYSNQVIVDNIFHDWGDHALQGVPNSPNFTRCYNLGNSITNAMYEYSEGTRGVVIGYQDPTEDSSPAFTDEANDDYTLSASSAAIDAGIVPGNIT